MFTDDFRAFAGDGFGTVECRGLRWQVTGWLDVPELTVDADEARFAGPAAGDPGVWLELRHTFDRTWQIRLSASSMDWAEWPGVTISATRVAPVTTGRPAEPDELVSSVEPHSPGGAMTELAPVWSWHLGAEGWFLAADHQAGPVLFGSLRRGMATDTDAGLRVPPVRLEPGRAHITAWAVQELSGVNEAAALLPTWLPSVTGVGASGEITLSAPDHGLVAGAEVGIDPYEDGLTVLTSSDPRGGCVSELLLHGARGTVTLPLAFGPTLADCVGEWAAELVERAHDLEQLAAEEAVILSAGASAGVAGAGQVLADLTIRTTGGAAQPLVVGACAMELARTGDPLWAGRLASAVEYLPAVPGAVSALVRAVVGTFAVNGDPQAYLDRIADLERAHGDRSLSDAIVALEVAAVGGWATEPLVERVAALLGWGLPLSPVLPVNPRTAVQAIAAMSMVDERVAPHWAATPSVITEQALRWILADGLVSDESLELGAWLLLPVTE